MFLGLIVAVDLLVEKIQKNFRTWALVLVTEIDVPGKGKGPKFECMA